MTISPQNPFPEQQQGVFERTMGPEITGNRGPQRFQEGVESDTDVPNDFARGAYADTVPGGPRNVPVVDAEHVYKRAPETMKERAHVGSASWIEAPEMLGDFVAGTRGGEHEQFGVQWERAFNSGSHMNRPNAVRVG